VAAAVEVGESSRAPLAFAWGVSRECVASIDCAIMDSMDLFFPLATRRLGD
jgi:hypothetical protein